MNEGDIKAIVDLCREKLPLDRSSRAEEYSYHSLPHCVIDAVFSIGVNYTWTRNTVVRFCSYVGAPLTTKVFPPPVAEQMSMPQFIELYQKHGVEVMAKNIFHNLQRTSPRSGILKADAVLQFSQVLVQHSVNYYQDVHKVLGKSDFEASIQQIKGQGSGLSLRYFYMLAGTEDYVKPDRMVLRFIELALHRSPSFEDCQIGIVAAAQVLAQQYSHMTPRQLDNLIWLFQSGRLG